MFGSIGMPELVIIMVIALLIFGPRKLPELGRSLGRSLGEFRRASNELRSTLEEEIRIEETREQKAKTAAEQDSALQQPSEATAGPSPLSTPPPTTTPADDMVSRPTPVDETVSRPTPADDTVGRPTPGTA
jgi:TatA/E family protein of Tat protein translocase